MARRINGSLNAKHLKPHQKGAALILMAFILGLGTAAYLIKTLNTDGLRAKQDAKTYQALKEAKTALIAWAVNYASAPGQMPWPDRNGDGNYDGSSDCVANLFSYSFLLGQLPSKPATSPCLDPNTGSTIYADLSTYPGLGQEFTDAQGNKLWYAVSRNLVYDSEHAENPVINPGMINAPHAITPYMRQSGTDSYPWLTVLDRNGNLVSDKVAAVIIAPGSLLGSQNRTSATPNASEYLDSFQIGGVTYNNRGYATADEDFIMGEDSRYVSASNTTYVQPYNFNDKLIYITIDELMAAIEKRIAGEAAAKLINYKNTDGVGYYPYASALNFTEPYQSPTKFAGILPTEQPLQTASKSCSVTYSSANASSTICDFSSIANVEFTRTSGTFSSTTGSGCARTNSNKTCQCAITSGSSRCNGSGGRRFTCTSSGCSTTGTLPGTYVFNGAFKFSTAPTNVKINSSSGTCNACGNTASCSYSAITPSGSFAYNVTTTIAPFNSATTNSVLPAWFTANNWQDYIYYAVSSNCTYGQPCSSPNITVGSKTAAQAMIATTGFPLIVDPYGVKNTAPQTHSSCDVKDYLDSTENTNSDNIYESTSKQRALNYNDQTFVVAP